MPITITITEDTVWEVQDSLGRLLWGRRPEATISGSEQTVTTPVAPTPSAPAVSPETTPGQSAVESPSPPSPEEITTISEPVKRRRGRPRKESAPTVAATPEAAGTPAVGSPATNSSPEGDMQPTISVDAGNALVTVQPTGAPKVHQELATGATEADGGTEADASATYLVAELAPVTDADLQRYCARLAQHYGKPDQVFALAAPFVPEGQPNRPSSIQGDEQRWAFIAAAEAHSGLKYHG